MAVARIEPGAIATRSRQRDIGQRHLPQHGRRIPGIGDAGLPGRAVRVAPNRADLAQLHQNVVEAALAQQIGDAVRDVALRHAVKCHRHAGPAVGDPACVDLDRAPVDQRPGGSERRLARSSRVRGRVGEMAGIEVPERLHGDVEGAPGGGRHPGREGQQLDQLERRGVQPSLAIQPRQRRVGQIEAEDPLEPTDLVAAGRDGLARRRAIGVSQEDRRVPHPGPTRASAT